MPRRKYYGLELANFICTTRDEENLLGVFEERIWPIFQQSVSRAGGETYEYGFHDVSIGKISGDVCVYGRLIQRMKLKARQKFTNGRLTPSEDTLDSDPSSLFILRLFDHKLLIIPEQPRSPKFGTFKWIFEKLIDQEYGKRFRQVREEFKRSIGRDRLSYELELEFRNILDAQYPKIEFSLNAIGDKESATDLLKKFDLVQSVTITAKKTNNEDFGLDEEMLKKHQKFMEEMGGTSSDIVVRNASDGLKKEKVKKLVSAAVETGGNTAFKVRGKGPSGEKIKKSEADAQVKVSLPIEDNESTRSIADKALKKFDAIISSGLVKVAAIVNGDEEKRKAEIILRRLREN